MKEERRKKLIKFSNLFSIIGIISISLAFSILWIFGRRTKILGILSLFGFLYLLMGIINISLNKVYQKKPSFESNPLLKIRMNHSLTHAIFYFGIGSSLIITNIHQIIGNWIENAIGLGMIILGWAIYEKEYYLRYLFLEKDLIKRNKKNIK